MHVDICFRLKICHTGSLLNFYISTKKMVMGSYRYTSFSDTGKLS